MFVAIVYRLSPAKVCAAEKLASVVDMTNETVGDAVSDLLLVETVLHYRGWDVRDWLLTYTDLPNRLTKVSVKVSKSIHILHFCICSKKTLGHIQITSDVYFSTSSRQTNRKTIIKFGIKALHMKAELTIICILITFCLKMTAS